MISKHILIDIFLQCTLLHTAVLDSSNFVCGVSDAREKKISKNKISQ
jgi:hypothetical protein